MFRKKTYGDWLRVALAIAGTAAIALAAAPSGAATGWGATPSTWNLATGFANSKPAIGDLNGDGKPDLMVGDQNGLVHGYQNIGTTTSPAWSAVTAWDLSTGGTAASPKLVDLNGDHLLDLVVGGRDAVRIYQNTGTAAAPVWTRATAWEIVGLSSNRFYTVAFGDLDGDGRIDMLLGDTTGAVTAYRNTGTAALPAWTAQPAWNGPDVGLRPSPALADLDGDGRIDLMLADNYGTVFAFHNTGTITAPTWTSIGEWFIPDPHPDTSSLDYPAPALGDLNADGLIDIMIGYSGTAGTITAYQNNVLPPPGPGTGPAPTPPDLSTVTDAFDTFTCPGAWKVSATGPNTSYVRDCSNGWTAFAQDVQNSSLSSPPPGPVGNQNVITADAANGPSAASPTPVSAAEVYTAPTDSVRGVLWLLRTFSVVPNRIIDTLDLDFRVKVSTSASQYGGVIVFDGAVTDPSGVTLSGVPQTGNVLASNVQLQGCGGNIWCPWTTVHLGGHVVPTKASITVALRLGDTNTTATSYAEFDNLKVSGVASPAQATAPVGDIAQLWTTPAEFAASSAGGEHNMAEPADVAVDAAGNSYVVGSTYTNEDKYDIEVIKYDPTGTQVAAALPYNGGDDDRGVAVGLDSSGNVYVIGSSYQGSDGEDFIVIKYDSNLNEQWVLPVDDGAQLNDTAVAAAVDASGDVYVTGPSCDSASCDYFTAKVTSGGSLAWAKTASPGGFNQPAGIAVDGSGNAYVTGTVAGTTSDDIATIKYDSAAGNVVWTQDFHSASNNRATAIVADTAGNTYIAGWNYGSGSVDMLLMSYTPGGALSWTKSYDSGGQDIPVALALNSTGTAVYVTGTQGSVGDHNIFTAMYQADGSGVWLRSYGNTGFDDGVSDIAVDTGGNVYVLGTLARSRGNTDFVTLRYDATGTIRNAITFDGYNVADTGVALALGYSGNGDTVPIVTGVSVDSASGLDTMATMAYEKAQPDLAMTQLSGPATGTAGSTISVTDTVVNNQDLANRIYADSGTFDVGYYLAPDVGGAPDMVNMTQIGSRTIANLTPGSSDPGAATLTIPITVTEGTYFLVGVADPGNVVVEKVETNNSVTGGQIAVQGVLPDLAVTGISGPASASRGDTVNITATVTDVVSISAGSFRVGLYLSSDTTISTSDTLLGSYTVAGLAGFASDSRTTAVTIPTGLTPGNYYIGVIADDQGAVTEADEGNNSDILHSGSANSTRLVTASDFYDGLTVAGTTGTAVIGTETGGHVTLVRSTAWTTNSAWDSPSVGASQRAKPALADLDGDGDLDMLIGSSSGITYGYENTGTPSSPTWTARSDWNIPAAGTYSNPVIVDLDGDGKLDVVVGGRDTVRMYRNTGSATSPVWTRMTSWEIAGLVSNRFYAPAAADLNGDGKPDLLLGTSPGTVFAYQNTGTTSAPAWTAVAGWNGPTFAGASPALADLDGDGRYDLMIGDNIGQIHGYRNTGTRTAPVWTANTAWDVADPNTSSPNVVGPALGDLDGDGGVDLMYGDISGVAFGYRNIGTYSSPGTYVSKVVDAGSHQGYTTINYVTTAPAGTTVTVDIRAGDSTTAGDGTWTPWVTGVANNSDISALGTHRYVQYRFNISSTDPAASAAVYSVQALTQGAPPQPTVVSVLTGTSSGGGSTGIPELLMLAAAGLLGRLARRRPLRN